ncbi:MAG: ATP-binding protein [Candidatus Woesearchaeota archaeon]
MQNRLKSYLSINKVKTFINNISSQNKTHAYLFSGYDNTSLKYIVNLVAMSFSFNNSEKPCLYCSNCKKILGKKSIDVFSYPSSNNTNILVKDIEQINDISSTRPLDLDYKIFILNNIENSSIAAQNKLLKILEEPPKYVIFILSSSNLESVLPTVKSRCRILDIPRLDEREIEAYLKDESNINKDKIEIASSNSFGHIGKALEILDNDRYFKIYDFIFDMILNMHTSKDMLKFSFQIKQDKKNLKTYLEILENLFRDLLNVKQNLSNLVSNKNKKKNLYDISDLYTNKSIIEILKRINTFNIMLNQNSNQLYIVDNLLISILEERYKWN